MILMGLARLGRDVEVRHLPDGTAVANLALAYNWGAKDGDGRRASQWVEGVLWGERAESLAPYLLKGQQLEVMLEDVRVETYDRNDNTQGTKMVGRVLRLEFGARPQGDGGQQQQQRGGQQRQQTGGGQQRQQSTQQQYSQQSRGGSGGGGRPARPPSGGGFDEMDDDIPF